MNNGMQRRDFLKMAGVGGVVFASRLGFWADAAMGELDDFFFVQLSDSHWGFNNPGVNPDSAVTLKKAIASVNSLDHQPDFVMFTGDLTHVTDDDAERRKRMKEVKEIIGELKAKDIKFMPGEHDAGLDEGKAFKEFFGEMHYAFDHKGIHFVVLDNVSDARSILGNAQLEWLADDLKKLDKNAPIIVFTHRPLFDLYPEWDWFTRDGGKAIEVLMQHTKVAVFYGHIHQENQHMTGHITHRSAQGSMYPLPAPGSVPVKAPVPWDPAKPYKGLGFRSVEAKAKEHAYNVTEFTITGEVVK